MLLHNHTFSVQRTVFLALFACVLVSCKKPHPTTRISVSQAFYETMHPAMLQSLHRYYGSDELKRKEYLLWNIKRGEAVLDEANYYIKTYRDSAMGGYERQIALFFSPTNEPLMIIAERNAYHAEIATHILCLYKDGNDWEDCASSVLPALTIKDFLLPGQTVGSDFLNFLDVYYELPRRGTAIKATILANSYAFGANYEDGEKKIEAELKKFRSEPIVLNWDKKHLRFERFKP
jgi:hypothetical protein